MLLIPKGHPLSAKEHIALSDLDGLALITTARGSDTRNNIDELCARRGIEPVIVFETIDNDLILKMVSEGAGCTVFAYAHTRLLPPSDSIAVRRIEDVCGEIGFSFRKDMPLIGDALRFAGFVREYFSHP